MLWLLTGYNYQSYMPQRQRVSHLRKQQKRLKTLCNIHPRPRLSYPMGDVPKDTGVCTDVLFEPPVLELTYSSWFTKTSWLILLDTPTLRRPIPILITGGFQT